VGELQKVAYSHEAMIDAMIANPSVSGGELARMFGYTESWISRIRSSNAFRERLRERAQEMVDPVLLATIEENFEAMVSRSQEILLEKLSEPAQNIDPQLALQCAALGAKAVGMGGFGAKTILQPAAREPNWLERSAERLRNLNSQGVIDVESREVPVPRQTGT
jgi:hypothetical protein